MANEQIEIQLADIQQKLDWLKEEIAAQKKQRAEFAELKDDLTLIAKDAFKTVTFELEDVAPFVKTGDFMHLLKKLLRNTSTITDTISKLESAVDFIEDASPIGKELFNDTLHKLDEYDRNGYFEFVGETRNLLDILVKNLSPDDIKNLADNLGILISLLKMLANTKVLHALESAIELTATTDKEQVEKFSPWMVHKELSTPEMRKIFGFLLFFFKNFVNEIKTVNNLKEA